MLYDTVASTITTIWICLKGGNRDSNMGNRLWTQQGWRGTERRWDKLKESRWNKYITICKMIANGKSPYNTRSSTVLCDKHLLWQAFFSVRVRSGGLQFFKFMSHKQQSNHINSPRMIGLLSLSDLCWKSACRRHWMVKANTQAWSEPEQKFTND